MPGRVISIGEPMPGAVWGEVTFEDRVLEINLVMLPDVEVGDHVLVHSGYAVRTVQGSVRDDAVKFPSSGIGRPE
jgi:hydrogenase maturation factor